MPVNHPKFRKMLLDLPGLRIDPDKLFIHDRDRLLVVSRFVARHPSESPFAFLDKKTLHDKLLELLENCRNKRDAMWMRSRMEPRLWTRVQNSTSWAHGIDFEVLRTLGLAITQAAVEHYKKPKHNTRGVPRPYCKLAITALRFAFDIMVYQSHLKRGQSDVFWEESYSDQRGPAHLENGKPAIDGNGRPVTLPVFDILHYSYAEDNPLPRGTLSSKYDETMEEPQEIKDLPRVTF
jgi:hypothetical protein